ncbi:MAG: histidinol-phosphate transaminase [Stanieria sp.]
MRDRFSFIRSDLAQLAAYVPNPGGEVTTALDCLDANESPFDLPSQLKEKLAWHYQQEISTNRYPDGSHQVLKELIAQYVNESAEIDSWVTTDHVSVGNGSDELIRSLLIATCLGGEGSILVANPTFSMYAILAKTLGIPIVGVERLEADFSIDLDAAQQVLNSAQNPPIRVVFVVHPNSPTGNALTPAEMDWLRSLPEDILVVIDEAYFEFSHTSVVAELQQHPNWVILRTFSKAFRLATHRVGYAIADSELITVLEKVRLPYNLPAFSQAAATIALQHRDLILPSVAEIIQERDKLWQALAEIEQVKVWQSRANFLYLRLQDRNLEEIVHQLKIQGTVIRHTGGGLRITIGTPAENLRTLQRLKALIS